MAILRFMCWKSTHETQNCQFSGQNLSILRSVCRKSTHETQICHQPKVNLHMKREIAILCNAPVHTSSRVVQCAGSRKPSWSQAGLRRFTQICANLSPFSRLAPARF